MKNTLRALSICGLLSAGATYAQFGLSDVQFWIGSGADSSVLVVDFQDGTFDPAYAWGYLHDGTATGEDMLNAVAAADANFIAEFTSGFLNSLTYGTHAGIGGSPDYWSTWTGTSTATMESNLGASEVLSNGEWFACSYTDFDPALPPRDPVAAAIPTGIKEERSAMIQIYPQPAADVLYVNTGNDMGAITVFDIAGKRVANLPLGSGVRSIDVSAWLAGSYVAQVGSVKRLILVQ